MNSDKKGKQYVPFGACFAGVGNGDTFKLSDIKLAGGKCDSDNIQVLDPSSAIVSKKYCFISHDEAVKMGDATWEGWWDYPNMDIECDDIEYPIGSAFLANFGTRGVTINYAGQVANGSVAFSCVGKQYVMFTGLVPRKFKLGELVMDGSKCDVDNVQFLNPENANVSAKYCYISHDEAVKMGDASWQGWWDFPNMDNECDDIEFEPGTGFLANFGTKNVVIYLPESVK